MINNGAGPKHHAQDSVAKVLIQTSSCGGRYRTVQLFARMNGGGYVPTFKAIVVEKSDGGQKVRLTDFDEANLMEGDVTVRVEWSTVNYKDGLAITGKAPVVRRFPMIAGIDFAGTVASSTHPLWKPGDRVILDGWGLGETHLGGYAERRGSRAIGWCDCPRAIARAARWRSVPPASPPCWR